MYFEYKCFKNGDKLYIFGFCSCFCKHILDFLVTYGKQNACIQF